MWTRRKGPKSLRNTVKQCRNLHCACRQKLDLQDTHRFTESTTQPLYDKLQMDLMYIAHPSIIQDLKIMLATVKSNLYPGKYRRGGGRPGNRRKK